MRTSDFSYNLPPELIAQTPVEPRDQSRFMILNRSDGSVKHHQFSEIVHYLRAGDVLVFNDSRVIPARLNGRKVNTGGRVEILLLRRLDSAVWETLVKPGKRVGTGTKIEIESGNKAKVLAEITGLRGDGIKVISFSDEALLPQLGRVPLPPYIHTPLSDPERYQTVYARTPGSAAAPTAGLHFTPELLREIEQKGVYRLFVTLPRYLFFHLSAYLPSGGQASSISVHYRIFRPVLPAFGRGNSLFDSGNRRGLAA